MTRIVAISVQTAPRLPAARPAAPVAAKPVATVRPADAERREPAPAVPSIAAAAMAVLIEAQAHGERGQEDPQPEHGRDDDHGHKPPPVVLPPVTQPPVAQPPVTQPPVSEPPPLIAPPPATPAPMDLAAPARAIAMIDRHFADEAISDAARSAFVAASAERRAAATVAQGQAALAVLQAVQADMSSFRDQALGRYEATRRLAHG